MENLRDRWDPSQLLVLLFLTTSDGTNPYKNSVNLDGVYKIYNFFPVIEKYWDYISNI